MFAGVHAWAAPTTSELLFKSSDNRLEQAFAWAKRQALAYAHDGADPVGAWYEAALPARNAFCMRDVSHQANGAAALGLNEANFNMLRRFAAAVAAERDWAGYWEIDVSGKPCSVDYVNDQDFWYNLPANFDVLDTIVRMWAWTGDDAYITDPEFSRFFRITANEYVDAWELEPNRVLARPRIMNRRLATGRNVESRGIPSYSEGQADFNVGVDLLAGEYRAFKDLALLAERDHDATLQNAYLRIADDISELIEKHAWSVDEQHYYGMLSPDGGGKSKGDMWVLHFGASKDPMRISGAARYLISPAQLNSINIEEQSYLPKLFFIHGELEAAYKCILSLSDPAQERREYPEVSFAIVDAIATGLMGIEVQPAKGQNAATILTISRLLQEAESATISDVSLQGGTIDVTHEGRKQTRFYNHSDKRLRWQAEFSGSFKQLLVDGIPTRAVVEPGPHSEETSSVVVDVVPRSAVTVSVH
jgi:hypothetical protein